MNVDSWGPSTLLLFPDLNIAGACVEDAEPSLNTILHNVIKHSLSFKRGVKYVLKWIHMESRFNTAMEGSCTQS